MRHIYSAIYVECVVKDPLYEPGVPFENASFTTALNNVWFIPSSVCAKQYVWLCMSGTSESTDSL